MEFDEYNHGMKKQIQEGEYRGFSYRVLVSFKEHKNKGNGTLDAEYTLLLDELEGSLTYEFKKKYISFDNNGIFSDYVGNVEDLLEEGKKFIDDVDFPSYSDYITHEFPHSLKSFNSKEEYLKAVENVKHRPVESL